MKRLGRPFLVAASPGPERYYSQYIFLRKVDAVILSRNEFAYLFLLVISLFKLYACHI